jgi:hypothetical protein
MRITLRSYEILAAVVLGLAGGCTTAPENNSPIGIWEAVDINNRALPIGSLVESHVELRSDSQWFEYYNNSTRALNQGVWTASDGRVSLTANTAHGEGIIRDGKLAIEWGFAEVYHYKRAP